MRTKFICILVGNLVSSSLLADNSNNSEQQTSTVDIKTYKESLVSQPSTKSSTKGFVLTKLRDDSIFHKWGLRDGDILLELNGIPIDVETAGKLLDEFSKKGGVLKYERNSVLKELKL